MDGEDTAKSMNVQGKFMSRIYLLPASDLVQTFRPSRSPTFRSQTFKHEQL